MFAIRLLPKSARDPEEKIFGEIVIGDFTERFSYFGPSSPEIEWRSQLQALLDGSPVVALIHDPRFAWVVYREGNLCSIQQRLSLDGRFNDLLPHETTTEDGDPISEWHTSTDAIKQFLKP